MHAYKITSQLLECSAYISYGFFFGVKGTVYSKHKCGLIERVLGTYSNEPSLASIRELQPSKKRRYNWVRDSQHVTTDYVRIA